MAEKTFINVLPEIRLTIKGKIVTATYNEAFKFYSYFLLGDTGLFAFLSDKEHKIGEVADIKISCKQYKFYEVK